VHNKNKIYTFKSVNFIVDNFNWCVAGITIILNENGIPEIRVVVDPLHSTSDSVNVATSPSLKDMTKWHSLIQHYVSIKQTASLSFIVEIGNKGEEKEDQKLELSGWIITGGGLLGVSAVGGFSLEITIQHPICLVSYSGVNMGGFSDKLEPMLTSSNTIIDALRDSIDAYINTRISEKAGKADLCLPGISGSDALVEFNMLSAYKEQLEAAAKAMVENLEWDAQYLDECKYSNWPLSTCLIEVEDQIKASVADYVYCLSDINLWEILVHRICSEWFVSIVPTYWTKLKMMPFTPWANPALYINEEDIWDLMLPGVEKNVIAGIYMMQHGLASSIDFSAYIGKASDEMHNLDGVVYVAGDKPTGSILTREAPAWLKSVLVRHGSKSGEVTNISTMDDAGDLVTPSNVDVEGEPVVQSPEDFEYYLELYRSGALVCANQLFLTAYKQSTQVSVNTRLLIKSHEKWVIPGRVCRIKAEDGTVIMDFYIKTVQHIIDFQTAKAYTQISGSYARTGGGVDGVAVNGTCNPVYSI